MEEIEDKLQLTILLLAKTNIEDSAACYGIIDENIEKRFEKCFTDKIRILRVKPLCNK